MNVIKEMEPNGRARQLRHTFVKGADNKHYKILTFKLYDFTASPEFATHETNVEEVNEKGARFVLVQPLIKRFFEETEAMTFHQDLLDKFDAVLNLKAPEKKEQKKAPPKPAPAAPKPAEAKKEEPKLAAPKPPEARKEEPKPAEPKPPEAKQDDLTPVVPMPAAPAPEPPKPAETQQEAKPPVAPPPPPSSPPSSPPEKSEGSPPSP